MTKDYVNDIVKDTGGFIMECKKCHNWCDYTYGNGLCEDCNWRETKREISEYKKELELFYIFSPEHVKIAVRVRMKHWREERDLNDYKD